MTAEGQPSRSGPIFIVGAMRSGTTLMRLVLDSHEHIAIPQETGVMRLVRAQKFTPFWKLGDRWYRHLGLTEDELDAELREFYTRLFRRFAASSGKPRWGEKTPWHVWHMEEIARTWPDAVFVGMVRHPGGNVGSMQTSWRFGLRQAIDQWQRNNLEMVRRAAQLGDRFVLCRYEDLVLHPEETMRELLTWLGEPWSPRVLEHHVVHGERGTPARVEGRTRSNDPIDVARVTRWAADMSEADRRRLEVRTSGLAGFFGYSFEDVARFDPVAPPGARWQRLLAGGDLAGRRAEFAHLVDFDTVPTVPLAERRLDPAVLTVAVRHDRARPRQQPGPGHRGLPTRVRLGLRRRLLRARRR